MARTRPAGVRSRLTVAASAPVRRARLRLCLAALLVGVATFTAFLPTLRNGFVNWDDDKTLIDNFSYRGLSIANLRWMFTTFHMGHYQPLSWLALAIDYEIWGMDPRGYHLSALVLHALNAVVVFFLARKLLRLAMPDAGGADGALTFAATAAALFFSLHPLRVESVAWATERRDVLSAFLYMLAVLVYVRAHEVRLAGRRDFAWMLLVVGLTFASFLAKVIAVTIVPVLLAIDFYPLRRLGGAAGWWGPACRRVWLEKLPLAAAGAVFFVLAMRAQAACDMELSFDASDLTMHLLLAMFGLSFYLWKTVLPMDLSPLYERPVNIAAIDFRFVAAGIGVVAGGVWFWLRRRERPALLVAFLCYLIPLTPVLGTYRDWPQCAADRYTYLSGAVLAILTAGGLLRLLFAARDGRFAPRTAQALRFLTVASVAVLATLTWRQTRVWSNSTTLWSHAIALDDRSATAYNNRGHASAQQKDYDQAIEDCDKAIRLKPNLAEAYNNRGNVYYAKGAVDQARQDYSDAIKWKPDYAEAYNNRGIAHAALGANDLAIQDCSEAINRKPDYAEAYYNRGKAYRSMGALDEAMRDYSRAIELKPDFALAYNNRGNIYRGKGAYDRALQDYDMVIELDPGFSVAYNNRAVVRCYLEQYDQAWADVRMCRQLGGTPRPELLGMLLQATGRTE